jgi:4-hydroxy-tetrahydrodipicolinate synthase
MTCTGLWPPVTTPFHADLSIDQTAFLAHCHALLEEGATGLAVLGTTSEANSLSMDERMGIVDAMISDGIPGDRILPGTGACAVPDAIALSRHATRAGCAGVLLLPPFFYKGVSDDGLFSYVESVVQGVDDDRLQIYLYHFPGMTGGVSWSNELIARLRQAFPQAVVGLKDSTGEWESTRSFIEENPGFAVFPANEALLAQAVPLGAVGCISATANVNARALAKLLNALAAGESCDDMAEAATALRKSFASFPLVPAVKAIVGTRYNNPGWSRVRPPLSALSDDQLKQLLSNPIWKGCVSS